MNIKHFLKEKNCLKCKEIIMINNTLVMITFQTIMLRPIFIMIMIIIVLIIMTTMMSMAIVMIQVMIDDDNNDDEIFLPKSNNANN